MFQSRDPRTTLRRAIGDELPDNSANLRMALQMAMQMLDGNELLQLRATLQANGLLPNTEVKLPQVPSMFAK